ncbi:hypothetical protein JCM3765_001073 [Sporobolomyces pararoseus]
MGRSKNSKKRKARAMKDMYRQVKKQFEADQNELVARVPTLRSRVGIDPLRTEELTGWNRILQKYETEYPGSAVFDWSRPTCRIDPDRLPTLPSRRGGAFEKWPIVDPVLGIGTHESSEGLRAAAFAAKCRIKRCLWKVHDGKFTQRLATLVDRLLSDHSLSILALAYEFRLEHPQRLNMNERLAAFRQRRLKERFLAFCFSLNHETSFFNWIKEVFSETVFPDIELYTADSRDVGLHLTPRTSWVWLSAEQVALKLHSGARSQQFTKRFKAANKAVDAVRKGMTESETRPGSCTEPDANPHSPSTDGQGRVSCESSTAGDGSENAGLSGRVTVRNTSSTQSLRAEVVSSTRCVLELSSRLLDAEPLTTEERQAFSSWLSAVSTASLALSIKAPGLNTSGAAARSLRRASTSSSVEIVESEVKMER